MAIFVEGDNEISRPADAEGGGGSAGVPFQSAEPESMASFVTRHAQNPPIEFKCLVCGIDSLDLGLFVNWSGRWEDQTKDFQAKKELSFGTTGILDKTRLGREFLHLPSGKPPRYRYHLNFSEYHLFISNADTPKRETPNLYASISAESLWLLGVNKVVELISKDIRSLGGWVTKVAPSRLDLAADFLIPGGLSYGFLQDHCVSRARASNPHFTEKRLETAYFGDSGSPIRLRIYDKSLEVRKSGKKEWFIPIWGIEENDGVWRIEFQMRRTVLKQFGVNSIEELKELLAGIWEHLTTAWFSLRLLDNEKTERRTTHPFWFEVQTCANKFGELSDVNRSYLCNSPASIDWYIAQTSGYVTSIAARLGNPNREEVFNELKHRIRHHCPDHEFSEEYIKRRIALGKQEEQGGIDEEEYPF